MHTVESELRHIAKLVVHFFVLYFPFLRFFFNRGSKSDFELQMDAQYFLSLTEEELDNLPEDKLNEAKVILIRYNDKGRTYLDLINK